MKSRDISTTALTRINPVDFITDKIYLNATTKKCASVLPVF